MEDKRSALAVEGDLGLEAELGGGFVGQEHVTLPTDIQHAVREDVRRSFPGDGASKPLAIELEVLVGSGQK